jgi:catechol 2,3-dioxygenase-like lactoylglutathione lyase family enzyme
MRLDSLTVTTKDIARSRAFYAAKLGFKVVEEREGTSFVVDAGGVKLHVDRDGARSPLARAEPRLVFNTDGLSARCTALRDLGVSVDGPRAIEGGAGGGGVAFAELSDPDGHPIVLIERK